MARRKHACARGHLIKSTCVLAESSRLFVRLSIPPPFRKSLRSLFERDLGKLADLSRESVLVGLSFQSSRVSWDSVRDMTATGGRVQCAWSQYQHTATNSVPDTDWFDWLIDGFYAIFNTNLVILHQSVHQVSISGFTSTCCLSLLSSINHHGENLPVLERLKGITQWWPLVVLSYENYAD